MKLIRLHFHRGTHDWDMDTSKPLRGTAEFDNTDGSKIKIHLNDHQSEQILEICKASIMSSVTAGLESMNNFLIEGEKPADQITHKF